MKKTTLLEKRMRFLVVGKQKDPLAYRVHISKVLSF